MDTVSKKTLRIIAASAAVFFLRHTFLTLHAALQQLILYIDIHAVIRLG